MTKSDFEALPHRDWNEDVGTFDSLVIIPMEPKWYQLLKYDIIQWLKGKFEWFDSWYLPDGLHDSGYRCMDFVAVKRHKPICRLSGCSDVIHLNGIGGYGKRERFTYPQEKTERIDWSIDCLKESGYLHLFTHNAQLEAGSALSSFEIYAEIKKETA